MKRTSHPTGRRMARRMMTWTLVGGGLLMALLGLGGPVWLTPQAPLSGAEALVIEGFWGDTLMRAAKAYLAAYPDQVVFVTGGNRESLTFQAPEPGTLRWTFGPQAAGVPQPVVRFKGHGRGCRGQETHWRVQVNDSVLFAGEMRTYEAQAYTLALPTDPTALRQVEIGMYHPDPDTTCAWVIWYLWVHNMESATDQRLFFIPMDSTRQAWSIPVNFGDLGRQRLIRAGVDSSRIISLPPTHAIDNRTYATAEAFATYLETHHPEVRRLNLLGGGYHGRRSWEAYRRALAGRPVEIGVVRLLPREPWHWWQDGKQRHRFLTQLGKYFGWLLWRLGQAF